MLNGILKRRPVHPAHGVVVADPEQLILRQLGGRVQHRHRAVHGHGAALAVLQYHRPAGLQRHRAEGLPRRAVGNGHRIDPALGRRVDRAGVRVRRHGDHRSSQLAQRLGFPIRAQLQQRVLFLEAPVQQQRALRRGHQRVIPVGQVHQPGVPRSLGVQQQQLGAGRPVPQDRKALAVEAGAPGIKITCAAQDVRLAQGLYVPGLGLPVVPQRHVAQCQVVDRVRLVPGDPQRLQAAFPCKQHDAVIASLIPIVQGLGVPPVGRFVPGPPDVHLPVAEDIERVAIRQQVVDIILLQLDQPVPLAQRRRRQQGQQDKY